MTKRKRRSRTPKNWVFDWDRIGERMTFEWDPNLADELTLKAADELAANDTNVARRRHMTDEQTYYDVLRELLDKIKTRNIQFALELEKPGVRGSIRLLCQHREDMELAYLLAQEHPEDQAFFANQMAICDETIEGLVAPYLALTLAPTLSLDDYKG